MVVDCQNIKISKPMGMCDTLSVEPRFSRSVQLSSHITSSTRRSVISLLAAFQQPTAYPNPKITMARKYLIGGNWKCNGTTESVGALVREQRICLVLLSPAFVW